MNTFTLHFPLENILQSYPIFSEMKSSMKSSLKCLRTVRLAFNFPDWNFFRIRTRSHFRTHRRLDRLWTIQLTFDFPDRLEFFRLWTLRRRGRLWTSTFRIDLNFFVFKLFEGMVIFELFDRSSTFRIDKNFFRLPSFEVFKNFFGGCSTEYYISMNSSTLEFLWRMI